MLQRPERIRERYPLVQDPPFHLDGTRAFLFALPCDVTALDTLLARTFSWAEPDVRVRSIAGVCLLVFTDVANATAGNPVFGSFSYQEATFFVPVTVTRGGTTKLAMHVPFIYPNSGLAIAAGREIYGLPKKPGNVLVPTEPDFWGGIAPLSLRALAADTFNGAPWADREIALVQSGAQTLVSKLESELLSLVDGLFGALPPGLGGLLKQDLVQLKQVADVTPGGLPARVLYRAVTSVRAPVDAISAIHLADPSLVTVKVADLASEPVRSVLGLAPIVTPILAAGLTMDFHFDAGEVWKEEPDCSGPTPPTKSKVLILGGGMGGLATALALTDTPARRARFDVRVLAEGHLLGGKGASTRNPDPALGRRSEEHGLHVLFGFYHNALRLMRSVYAEAARPAGLFPQTFDEAFDINQSVVFHDGTNHYTVQFPVTPRGWGADDLTPRQLVDGFVQLVESLIGGSLKALVLGTLFPSFGNPVARDILVFTATLVEAVISDIVIGGKTWDDLDALDFRAWMKSHHIPGTHDITHSAIMQVPYDGVFAYEGSGQTNPRLSAGIAARGLLTLATRYEIGPYYAMTAGMGEVVFSPIYEVLKARGVRFEFFAKVKEVHVDGTAQVDFVRYAHQATVTAGPFAYDPTTTVGTVPAWKNPFDASQLTAPIPIAGKDPYSDAVTDQVPGDHTLAVTTDFDWVVCALPAPVSARVLTGTLTPELQRIANIPTVATLHLQTWFNDRTTTLGWNYAAAVLGGFPQPLNSMQLRDTYLDVELWLGPTKPNGLLYASGPFGGGWATDSFDPAARALAATAADNEARAFIATQLWRAVPAAATPPPPTFDAGVLFAPSSPADPIAAQYIRHNIDLSSRYVLIRPGGLADRPTPVPPGLVNLRLAGDWTKNGVDIPCIEGTVVSALLAAESILGPSDPITIL